MYWCGAERWHNTDDIISDLELNHSESLFCGPSSSSCSKYLQCGLKYNSLDYLFFRLCGCGVQRVGRFRTGGRSWIRSPSVTTGKYPEWEWGSNLVDVAVRRIKASGLTVSCRSVLWLLPSVSLMSTPAGHRTAKHDYIITTSTH